MTTARIKTLAERSQKAQQLVKAGRSGLVYGLDDVYCVLNGEAYAYVVNPAQKPYRRPDARCRTKKLGIPYKHGVAAALYAEQQRKPVPRSYSRPPANGTAEPPAASGPTTMCELCSQPTNGNIYCLPCSRELPCGEVASRRLATDAAQS